MAIFSTSAGFETILTTGGEQAHLKGFPSRERGNNTIWHNRQNGQTATEQPAQTQVVKVYWWLSGRRGMRVLCSHSTQVKVEREENIDICGRREISDLAPH